MSEPSKTSAPDRNDKNENPLPSAHCHAIESEESKLTSEHEDVQEKVETAQEFENPNMFQSLEQADSDNIGNTSEGERQVVSHNEAHIKEGSKELSVSDSLSSKVVQTGTRSSENISETERVLFSTTQDCINEDLEECPVSGQINVTDTRKISTVKRKLEYEVKEQSSECSNDLHPLESPNKVIKSISSESDVKTEMSPKLRTSEGLHLSDGKTETSPKLYINEALGLSYERQELHSEKEDIVKASANLKQETEIKETVKEFENANTVRRNINQSGDDIPIPEIDLVKLYRIEKWLSGISTLEFKGNKAAKGDQCITGKTKKLKRKYEIKDQIPGCSKSLESPSKVLKTPEPKPLDDIPSKSEVTKPSDQNQYSCIKCFQTFVNQQDLEEHKASCNPSSQNKILKSEKNLESDPMQGSSISEKETPSDATLEPSESTCVEQHTIPSSEMLPISDADYNFLMPVFTCPDCGCLLSRASLDSCYYHAVTCFCANRPAPEDDVVLRTDEWVDAEGNYLVTENYVSIEELNNILSYMTDFMRATVEVIYTSEECPSSSSDESYYECPICFRKLESQALRNHIKAVHIAKEFSARDAARELAADAIKYGFVRGQVFKCKKCGEKFSSREGIKLHIDAFINGDCRPGGSEDAASTGGSAWHDSNNNDFGPGSSQAAQLLGQTAESGSEIADCCPRSSQSAEFAEQNARPESSRGSCCPGSSQITGSMERNTGRMSKQGSAAKGCSSENTVKGDSEFNACNCVKGTAFTCRFCDYACENLDDMVDHYSIHELLRVCYSQEDTRDETEFTHKCPNCLKEFESLEDVIDHLEWTYKRPLTCVMCHEFFKSEVSYQNHLEMHNSDLYKLYEDSQNKDKKDVTSSNEDQEVNKSTPKRRKRRSKKMQENKNSEQSPSNLQPYRHSPNTNQMEILQSNLNNTPSPNDETRPDSYVKSTQSDKLMKQKISNSSPTGQQIVPSPKIGKDDCTTVNCKQEDNKRESLKGENKDLEKDIKEDAFILRSLNSQTRSPQPKPFSTNVPSDQEEIGSENPRKVNKEPKKNLEKHTSATNAQIPKRDLFKTREFLPRNITSDEKAIHKEVNKESKNDTVEKFSVTSSFPETLHSAHIQQIVSEKAKISSDQKDISREESKKPESNLEESISATASSSIPQILDLPNKQVIFTYASSDQEELNKEESKKSESNLEESIASTASSSIPQILDLPNKQQVIFTYASSDKEELNKEESKKSESNLEESIAATASSSIPQIIALPNKQQVIFTYASSDREDISRKTIKESKKNLEGGKYVSNPLKQKISPLARTKKLASIENYDADVSTGASSDDQEIVQVHPCGTYVIRSRTLEEQSSLFAGETSHRCTKCNVTFASASNFVAHNLMHSIFLCLKCNTRFSLKSSFLDHLALHTGRTPFTCLQCWLNFPTRIDLQIHQHLCSKKSRYS